jgi:hypothetical protein
LEIKRREDVRFFFFVPKKLGSVNESKWDSQDDIGQTGQLLWLIDWFYLIDRRGMWLFVSSWEKNHILFQ